MIIMNLMKRYGIDVDVDDLVYDTRDIKSNKSLFFCINEASYSFVEVAIELGAVLIVSNRSLNAIIPHVVVDDVLIELSDIAAEFNGYPNTYLDFIALTGTDGKTTTAQIIQSALQLLQGNCGYIGTNGVVYNGFNEKYFCTVPFPPLLHKSLKDMKDANEKTVIVEATSQGLELKRLEALEFDILVFTNFTLDHLDFHKTKENYLKAKLHSLNLLKSTGVLVVNVDDEVYVDFVNNAENQRVLSYGIKNSADFMATNIRYYSNKIAFDISFMGDIYPIQTNLIGEFNVYNILAAVATIYSYGYSNISDVCSVISKIESVEGRSMFVKNDLGVDIIIDFAHTSNAVENILSFLRKTTKAENKRLISLMGVPGRRDSSKRPVVGKILTTYSDFVYFTSDDPRDEDPNTIIDELTSQVVHNSYKRIVDRKLAIKKMITNAQKGDVLVLLGKGAENKFAIGDKEIDYLEEDVVKDVLKSLKR